MLNFDTTASIIDILKDDKAFILNYEEQSLTNALIECHVQQIIVDVGSSPISQFVR